VFNLEWRYEIWRELQERSRVETFLFLDEGAVADELSRVSLPDFRSSFGVGFRVVSGQGLSSVVYVAFGAEGVRPAVAATVPF
jgi:outer membrane protein assembly factor BamA